MTLEIAKAILENENFTFQSLHLFQSRNVLTDYLIDDKIIIRLSTYPLDGHKKQFLVNAIDFTPKIYHVGDYVHEHTMIYYLIFDYIEGEELLAILPLDDPVKVDNIGKDIANFLYQLHTIRSDVYDIGFYIPTVPKYPLSWKAGHLKYIEYLKEEMMKLVLDPSDLVIIEQAFDYLHAHIDVLDYQRGPCLLHNDFHPKNIIIKDGRVSGIIDWECAQYGEPDFDLVHLFHWSIFPPNEDKSFDELIQKILHEMPQITMIPHLPIRLTIYQMEHELNQIIWSQNKDNQMRMEHLTAWLNHVMESKLNEWLKENDESEVDHFQTI